jgi:hypothetical protein
MEAGLNDLTSGGGKCFEYTSTRSNGKLAKRKGGGLEIGKG